MYDAYSDTYDDYLMHHGVKGMKWGVRRYQNKDGSLTSKGAKRYSTAGINARSVNKAFKYLEDGNFDSSRKRRKHDAKFQRRKFKTSEEYDKAWDEEKKYEHKSDKEIEKDYKIIRNRIVNDPAIKNKMSRLNQLINESDVLEDKYISYKSDAYKKALSEYKQKSLREAKTDNDRQAVLGEYEYGFDHYVWHKGNSAYDKAYGQYKEASKSIGKESDELRVSMGETLTKGFANKRVKNFDYNMTYSEAAQAFIDQYARYDMNHN